MMEIDRVLVLYKESNYKLRLYDTSKQYSQNDQSILSREKKRLKMEHDQHYRSLEVVKGVLELFKVKYKLHSRANKINYNLYDCVITIGGDGTFLEAARHVKEQPIMGVNSAPDFSVGKFCLTTALDFQKNLKKILSNSIKPFGLHQISGMLISSKKSINAINDFLICHQNPAALCRYIIEIGKYGEVHRSSGLWIATSAGSSGAIKSAGGRNVPIKEQAIQYKPRELYVYKAVKYKLKGAVLSGKQHIKIISLMKDAQIYVDGAHKKVSFPYGETFVVEHSKKKIKTFVRQAQ